ALLGVKLPLFFTRVINILFSIDYLSFSAEMTVIIPTKSKQMLIFLFSSKKSFRVIIVKIFKSI
ncbi:MAG: hypothetical protein ACTSQS_15565, partial [Promethearchaeota archaeon]